MMNVLIVDDQKHIRDGLQAMLGQFSLPLASVHNAANGLEALAILRTTSIQLVITDIRMPDMDGLELMAQTREEQLRVDYLIISGYNDFAYAQKAIGLGAKGYLLKPVKREDLQTALGHVTQEISTRQELRRSMEHLSIRAKETDRKELSMFMRGAASDEAWVHQTEQQNPQLWGSYRLCLLREDHWMNQSGASSASSIELAAYQVYGRENCICLQHRPQLILAVDAAVDLQALTLALQERHLQVVMAVTGPWQRLAKLPECYEQVMSLYQHSYLFPEKRFITPAHMDRLERQWQLPHDKLHTLFQLVGTKQGNQGNKIAEGISRLFHKDVLQRYHIRYTQQLCRAFVQLLEEYERVIRPYLGEEELDIASLNSLFDYPGIREYIQALQQQMLRLHQLYYAFKCSYRNSQDLNEAIRFIHENYHKPLDLAMVSNHVSLNYAYFSNLFKKNVGKGFAEYLRDVRMDKARRLLAETGHKIVEISAMVGYESYKSFTRAFRDVAGMQPTEYRQVIRRQKDGEDSNSTMDESKKMG